MLTAYLFLHVLFNVVLLLSVGKLRPTLSIHHPLSWYLIFHWLVFVLQPLVSLSMGSTVVQDYMGVTFTDIEYRDGFLVVNVALLAFYAGGILSDLGRAEGRATPKADFQFVAFKRSVIACFILLAPLALYSAWKTLGGFTLTHYEDQASDVVMEMVNGVIINTNQVGYFVEFKNVLATLIFLTCVALRFNKLALSLLAFYIAYRLYLGWQRVHAVVLLVQVGMYFLYVRGRSWPKTSWVIAGAVAVPFFSFLGQNRDYIKNLLNGETGETAGGEGTSFWEGLDFANFDFLLYILRVVPDLSQTFTYGTQYLQLITEPIPRVFWPEKPIGPPVVLVDLMQYGNFVGLTKSIVGDAWMSFGWAGVILLLLFWGYALQTAYTRMFLKGSPIAAVFWIALLPYSMQLFRDGGVVSIARFLIFASLPLLLSYSIYVVASKRGARVPDNVLR